MSLWLFALPFLSFLLLCVFMCTANSVLLRRQKRLCAGCEDCDFSPRQIRDFYVTSARGEALVTNFYVQLQDDQASANYAYPRELVLNEPLQLLEKLYDQPCMWEQVEGHTDGELPDHLKTWLQMMTYTFYKYVAACMSHIGALKRAKEMDELLATCIQFHDALARFSALYTHPRCPLTQTKLRATLLGMTLRLTATDGFLPAFLVFAHLRPDMVNDDCYPKINNDTFVYNSVDLDDVERYDKLRYLVAQYEDFVIL